MVKILFVTKQLNNTIKILAEHLFNQNYQIEILTGKGAALSNYKTHVPVRAYFKYWNGLEVLGLTREFLFQRPHIIHFFDFEKSTQLQSCYKIIAHLASIQKCVLSYSFFEQNFTSFSKQSGFFNLFHSISFPASTHINNFRSFQNLNSKIQIYYLPYLLEQKQNRTLLPQQQEASFNKLATKDQTKALKLLKLRAPYYLAYVEDSKRTQFIKTHSVNILMLGNRMLNENLTNSFYLAEDEDNLELYISHSQKVVIDDSNLSNYKLNLIANLCQKHRITLELNPNLTPLLWSLNAENPQNFIDEILNKQTRIYENSLN